MDEEEQEEERQPTLLTLSIVDAQAKQRRPLAPQQSDITGGQVQLENRGIHVLRPKDEITIMRDPERMVQLFSIVHHLQHEADKQCNQKIREATPSATKKKKSIISNRALAV